MLTQKNDQHSPHTQQETKMHKHHANTRDNADMVCQLEVCVGGAVALHSLLSMTTSNDTKISKKCDGCVHLLKNTTLNICECCIENDYSVNNVAIIAPIPAYQHAKSAVVRSKLSNVGVRTWNVHCGTISAFVAPATTSRSYRASPLTPAPMDAQYDVRNCLPNVDVTSTLRGGRRSGEAAAQKLRRRQQTHTHRISPHEEPLPRPQFTRRHSQVCHTILVTAWAVSSVTANAKLFESCSGEEEGLDPMEIVARALLQSKTPTLTFYPPPGNSSLK